ncbi:MAG: CcmD family protein [Bacteroidetes bacterium]|jgi:cytochrome c biogenesis protein CcdA|nr:MAG: CcmD family protein [Bacteroidota bacterium]
MKKMKYLLVSLLLLGGSTILNAQDDSQGKSVGNFMYSNQRSYVVIAVMLTILLGLILFMVRVDRKLTKLEKENK